MQPQSPIKIHWLSFFRVTISAICLFNFLSLQADFDLLFGSKAYAPPDMTWLLSNKSYIPSLLKIHEIIYPVLHISYDDYLTIFRILYITSLISLLVGFYSRLSAVLSLVLFVVFVNSYAYYTYGFDCFANISLFYCCIFPVGNYDALKPSKKIEQNTKKYLTVLQTHICIAYFFTGFEKILGVNWHNGESLWKALHNINYSSSINLDFLANTPFFVIVGWLTIILEMLYPIFINIEKTRKIWLIGIIGLHLSIAVLMGLTFFSAIMILLNITAYYIPFKNSLKGFSVSKFYFCRRLKSPAIN